MARFEQLPNEVFLEIFEYCDGIDLLNGFADLNARFRALLYGRFLFYRFCVCRTLKRRFDMFCEQHLPYLCSRIAVLELFGGLTTPNAIDLFFSHVRPLTRLRSLLISDFHSHPTKTKFLDHLPYMVSLTHLHLQLNQATNQNEIDRQLLTDAVWSLPNLARYNLFERISDQPAFFALPSVVSPSLRHFSTLGRLLQWFMLGQLFQHTPNLRILRARMAFSHDDYFSPSSPFLSLTKLTIEVVDWPCLAKFFSFLQNIPNLRYLDVDLLTMLIDGHHWQKIIHTFLLKLKTFELSMKGTFDTEDEVEQLIDTFRSPFWTTERRFFVRCFAQGRALHLQTKSKWNYYSQKSFPRLFKSTYPQDDFAKLSEQLTSVYETTFFDHPFPANVRFSRLSSLTLKFPIAEHFWQVVPSFAQLTSLSISSYANQFSKQLQRILDRAPRLNSMSIDQEASAEMDMSWCERASMSITELTLSGRSLNGEECRALSCSPLAKCCETLEFCVEHWSNVIVLVNAMPKLQSLSLHQCFDNDSLARLRNQLPSSSVISQSTESTVGIHICLS